MSKEERDIRITGVDKAGIKESGEYKGTWVLPFKLSAKPDESWARNFYDVHKKNSMETKKRADVVDDCIQVYIVATDDVQKILDAAKIDVMDTNAICEENFQKKIQIQVELDSLRKRQAETIAKIKDDSDKLQF